MGKSCTGSQPRVQQLRIELKDSNGTVQEDNGHRELTLPCSANDLLTNQFIPLHISLKQQ